MPIVGGSFQNSTASTWNTWVSTGSTTVNYTLQDPIWNQWTATGSTNAIYNQGPVWNQWNVVAERAQDMARAMEVQQARIQAMREQVSRDRLIQQRARELDAKKRAEAEERAEELLPLVLTVEEMAQYEQEGQVWIRGSAGGYYVVMMERTVHGNVYTSDEHGCRLMSLCAAPQMYDGNASLPLMDGWVGQILAIKNQEEHYLERANPGFRHPCRFREGLRVAA